MQAQPQNDKQPHWLGLVQDNAIRYADFTEKEFQKALEFTVTHAPENNPKNRALILNAFFDVMIGQLVKFMAKYGNTSEQTEAMVIESIKGKFAYIRENAKAANVEKGAPRLHTT